MINNIYRYTQAKVEEVWLVQSWFLSLKDVDIPHPISSCQYLIHATVESAPHRIALIIMYLLILNYQLVYILWKNLVVCLDILGLMVSNML